MASPSRIPARANSDFAVVRPALEELLRLVREAATAKAEVFGCSRYDALLAVEAVCVGLGLAAWWALRDEAQITATS